MNWTKILKTTLIVLSVSLIASGLVVIIVFLVKLSNEYSISGDKVALTETGNVGSFIGGIVGSLWSLSGVILFFLALRLQSEEIGNQITELQETRKVFINQQFESNFYNLLRTQQEITNGISVKMSEIDSKGARKIRRREGREFFRVARKEIKRIYQTLNFVQYVKSGTFEKEREIMEYYKKYSISQEHWERFHDPETPDVYRAKMTYYLFFNIYHHQIGHYFRHLYHVIKFVDDHREQLMTITVDEIEKRDIANKYLRYIGIIQAQMSSPELFLLFYNGLCFDQTYDLIERYDLLENLAVEDLIVKKHQKLYQQPMKTRKKILEL